LKTTSPWFLLAIVLFQWIGGVLVFQVSHYVAVQRQMNAMEQTIAERVKEKTGASGLVKIRHQDSLIRKGAIYQDFVFSEEINGETVYFEWADESKAVTVEKVTHRHTPVSSTGKAILVKSIVQECIVADPIGQSSNMPVRGPLCATYPQGFVSPFLSIPTPPPLVC
jgi:hypothetical protein